MSDVVGEDVARLGKERMGLCARIERNLFAFFEADRLRGQTPSAPSIIVAWSGGADSTALLHALGLVIRKRNDTVSRTVDACSHSNQTNDEPAWRSKAWSILAVYIDHGMRPESAAEASQLGQYAKTLGAPYRSYRLPTTPSSQADARDARYAALSSIATEHGASIVVTGHHRSDQVETILQRIVRGTGSLGLGGMAISRPLTRGASLVRPLLTASRAMIDDYVREHHLRTVTDPSNVDRKYTRATIRHDILPLLAQLNPQVESAILQLSHAAASENDALRQLAAQLKSKATKALQDTMLPSLCLRVTADLATQINDSCRVICLDALTDAHPEMAWRAVRQLCVDACASYSDSGSDLESMSVACVLSDVRATHTHVIEVKQLLESDRRSTDAFGCVLQKAGKDLWVIPLELYRACRARAKALTEDAVMSGRSEPVFQRSVLPGDRIMLSSHSGGGRQKVSDYFINNKIPAWTRALVPIFIKQDQIIGIGTLWAKKDCSKSKPSS